MAAPETNVEAAFEQAREQYAEWGVDVDAALRRLSTRRDLAALLAGGRRGRIRGDRPGDRRRPGGHRQLSRPGPHAATSSARTSTAPSPSCPAITGLNLHASYAEAGAEKVERDALEPEHFRGWIDWAKSRRIGMDFNPTYFAHPLAADGYTLAHPDPGIRRFWIDHGIACRRIGAAIGTALGVPVHHQRLDSRRLQGAAHRPQGPAHPAGRVARRRLRRADRPEVQQGRRRGQALRHRLGELRRRLARVLLRLRRHAQEAPLPRRRPLSPDRGRLRQDLRGAPAPGRDPAARQPRRALGQRPRRDPLRRAGGDRAGAGPGRLPRPRAHRPRLLRRQHQPRRRLGHRRPRHAQGAARSPCSSRPSPSAASRPRATTPPGWPSSRSSRPCPSAPSGTITAAPTTSPPAATGWPRSRTYERSVLSHR